MIHFDEKWYDIWVNARLAMPDKRSNVQWEQLARVLEITFEELTKNYWGLTPQDPEITRKLNLLASPFGKALAKKKLKELDESNG